MNVNPKILKLKDVVGCPVAPDIYDGKESKWIVFSYTDERASLYGDNDEEEVEVTLNVVLYTQASYNYFSDKKKIKNALIAEGFQIEHIQSWLLDELEGVERIRQTIFTVNYTDYDNY